MRKILIVEDEISINDILTTSLKREGDDVKSAFTAKEAERIFNGFNPDLVLLDLMLPDGKGEELCKVMYKKACVIMITAKSNILDKLNGMEIGADDYITKPFSVRELMARVKAVLRRYTKSDESSEKFVFGDIEADFENHSVICAGEKIELTLKEFELLEVLVKNRGKILTREMLLDKIWGYEYIGESRTVDVHIRYLRKKVEKDDKNPKFIETIRGVGYRFNPHV